MTVVPIPTITIIKMMILIGTLPQLKWLMYKFVVDEAGLAEGEFGP